jgi:hypothetical protein
MYISDFLSPSLSLLRKYYPSIKMQEEKKKFCNCLPHPYFSFLPSSAYKLISGPTLQCLRCGKPRERTSEPSPTPCLRVKNGKPKRNWQEHQIPDDYFFVTKSLLLRRQNFVNLDPEYTNSTNYRDFDTKVMMYRKPRKNIDKALGYFTGKVFGKCFLKEMGAIEVRKTEVNVWSMKEYHDVETFIEFASLEYLENFFKMMEIALQEKHLAKLMFAFLDLDWVLTKLKSAKTRKRKKIVRRKKQMKIKNNVVK